MTKKIYFSLIIFLSFFLGGCNLQPAGSDQQLIGGDRDEHGCIGSAGYTWCEPKQKCLREWEEPCTQQEVFDLLNNLKSSTTINFSGIGKAQVQWRTDNNVLDLEGKTIEASEVPNQQYSEIANFFENQGFQFDLNNAADGPTGGLEGYQKGNIVCLVSKTFSDIDPGGGTAPITAKTDNLNVQVKCSELKI